MNGSKLAINGIPSTPAFGGSTSLPSTLLPSTSLREGEQNRTLRDSERSRTVTTLSSTPRSLRLEESSSKGGIFELLKRGGLGVSSNLYSPTRQLQSPSFKPPNHHGCPQTVASAPPSGWVDTMCLCLSGSSIFLVDKID